MPAIEKVYRSFKPLGLDVLAVNLTDQGNQAGVAAFIYAQRRRLPLRLTLDALAPGLAVFMIFLGVSHMLNGDAYGAPTNLPRRIFLWSEYRHPIRVYEILVALGIFLFTMKLPLAKSGRGLNFSLAIALSAGARLLLEAFRGESLIWPGGIRAAQAVSLIILGISLRLMRAWSQSQIQSQAQTDEAAS